MTRMQHMLREGACRRFASQPGTKSAHLAVWPTADTKNAAHSTRLLYNTLWTATMVMAVAVIQML